MTIFRKYFFVVLPAVALACAFCGIPSFAEDQAEDYAEDLANDWYAVRAEAFAWLDKDGKGYITLEDWPGVRIRAFRLMDVNRDGRVTLEEFQSLRLHWWKQTFESLDLDGNGIITRDEWMDVEEAFDRLDRNKDGMITRREFYGAR